MPCFSPFSLPLCLSLCSLCLCGESSIRPPPPGRGGLEAPGGGAEADADLPEEVGLVLGQQVLHHDLVGGWHAGVLEDDAEAGLGALGAGGPDLDQAGGAARGAVVFSAVQEGEAGGPGEFLEPPGAD